MTDAVFHDVVNFIRTHNDHFERIKLPKEKYRDWGTFIRTFGYDIPDEVCPRYIELSLKYGEIKPVLKRCVICDHCKDTSSYDDLGDLYLFYGYWFWQDIIDGETFIKIIERKI